MDMMTLVAMKADPAFEDEDLALRNVIGFVVGGANTQVHPLGHAIDEMEKWFIAHPEDFERRTEPRFLLTVLNEVLRLHPVSRLTIRVAAADVTLSSGLQLKSARLW